MTKKALIVDDAKVVRTSLGRIMNNLGFEVLEAANGPLTQEKVHDGIPVFFLGWNMPVMNAYGFLVALRSDSKHIIKLFDKEKVQNKLDIVGIVYQGE